MSAMHDRRRAHLEDNLFHPMVEDYIDSAIKGGEGSSVAGAI